MEKNRLGTMEYRFLTLIWDNEPLTSMELVKKCDEAFDWKKSTTFTMLRKMKERGFIENDNSVVTSRVDRKEVERAESDFFMDQTFSGSLPHFLTTFLNGKTISDEEAEDLKRLIDSFRGK
jgi:predicted transcriptional regulator